MLLSYAEVNISVTNGKSILLDDPSGVDYVFIFSDLAEAEMTTADNNPQWWRMEGMDSVMISNAADFFPKDTAVTTTYILHTDEGRVVFAVVDYGRLKVEIEDIEVDLQYENICEETKLNIKGKVPQLYYFNQYGAKKEIDRKGEITYSSLGWSGEQWEDSLCVESIYLPDIDASHPSYIIVGAPLCNTQFALVADQYAKQLDIETDTVYSLLFEACASAAHITSITTVRGTAQENQMTNEVERPVDEAQLSGSAPLDILFKANANNASVNGPTKYYQWRILKGNELIAQRNDEEQRYVFDDYGEYRVLLWVSSDRCRPDSLEVSVSVSTSQLLVPNVFTPNGDGQNDEFRVMYRSIIEFDCWVYNRWGKLVYHWSDPAKGWDGTINGRPAAEGAYFYVIRAKGADAEEGSKYTSKSKYKKNPPIGIYQLSGDINLLRGK